MNSYYHFNSITAITIYTLINPHISMPAEGDQYPIILIFFYSQGTSGTFIATVLGNTADCENPLIMNKMMNIALFSSE